MTATPDVRPPTRSHPPTRRGDHLPTLAGLRFVAAALVLLCHLGISLTPRVVPEDFYLARWFNVSGAAGVTFFFVLSGFVLTWVARPGERVGAFWRRRALKLFPNHVVTTAAAVVLALAAGLTVSATSTVPTLLLVQTWIPSQTVLLDYTGNFPSWSLACEVFFYLCFPALVVLVRRIPDGRLWATSGAVVATMVALPFAARLLPDEPQIYGLPWWEEWFLYYFPPVRALEFVLGVLMATIVLRGRWRGPSAAQAVGLSAVGFVLAGVLIEDFKGSVVLAAPFALLVAAAAVRDVAGGGGLLARPTAVRLGEISFALYMVHWLVISYGPIGLADPEAFSASATLGEALLDAALTVVISLVLAAALYTLVERPAMRRFARSRRTPVDQEETS